MPITSPSGILVSNTREWIIIALEEAFVNHPLFRISSGSQAPPRYLDERKNNDKNIMPAYEEMLVTEREISDGVTGRKAYHTLRFLR